MMQQSPAKNTKGTGGATKAMTSMAFMVSVVVHLVIFLFVGSVVIFEGAIPPNLFTSMGGEMMADESADEMELPPLMEEEFEPEQLETPMDELQMDTEMDVSDVMDSSDLIVSNVGIAAPTFSQPKLSVGSSSGTKMVSAAKKSKPASSVGGPRTAKIFGRTVTAGNFGAVLDISWSTHGTINRAVDEVKSGFPDAVLVLAPGCGMKASETGEIIKGKEFEDNVEDYYFKGKRVKEKQIYTASFFEGLLASNKDFKRLWSRAVSDDRGYVLQLDLGKQPRKHPKTGKMGGPARIHGTQHAVEFLIEEGCDVIYWMADFSDGIDQGVGNDILKNLKRNDVKLIVHNFNGTDANDKKNQPILQKMVKETGGEMIIAKGK